MGWTSAKFYQQFEIFFSDLAAGKIIADLFIINSSAGTEQNSG